mgnify:CR=1 FL=1
MRGDVIPATIPLAAMFAVVVFGAVNTPAFSETLRFDGDDFLVAEDAEPNVPFGVIHVYDYQDSGSGFSFNRKGTLFPGQFDWVHGLAFDQAGQVVGVSRRNAKLAVYDECGVQTNSFSTLSGGPTGVAVSPTGNFLVANQLEIQEFSPAGVRLRALGQGDYKAVAMVPGNRFWGGGGGSGNAPSVMDIFDLTTGLVIQPVPFDNPQKKVPDLCFSASTDSVLIADFFVDAIFERSVEGAFIRRFADPASDSDIDPVGVTRGPNGFVFAVDGGDTRVHRWRADGTYAGFDGLDGMSTGFAAKLLWAGNVSPSATWLVSAASRRTQGGVAWDLDIPLGAEPPTDPRVLSVGAPQMVMTFNHTIESADGAVDCGGEVVLTGANCSGVSIDGAELIVDLAFSANENTCVRVTMTGLRGAGGGLPMVGVATVSVRMNEGDAQPGGPAGINILDLQAIKNGLLQPLDEANFFFDVNADGVINILDLAVTKNRIGTALASCP